MNIHSTLHAQGYLSAVSRARLRAIRLASLITLAFSLNITAMANAQVTITETNAPLQRVLKKIQSMTGYDFLYDASLVEKAGNVTVSLKNVSIGVALTECLKGKSLTYTIMENTVVIRPVVDAFPLVSVQQAGRAVIPVRGKVVNESGEPVSGVTVSVKGSAAGTSTDANGLFEMTVPSEDAILVFTSVNMERVELSVRGRSSFDVTMQTRVVYGQNVVVRSLNTGYQSLPNERSAGSFAKPNEVLVRDRANSTNILQRLDGLVPGLTVSFAQGARPSSSNRMMTGEGNSNQFIIRGIGSVQGDRAPLYVVNGIILDDISALNANDVEDVTLLKDATAASIWGSRAANGVVVITTKKGTARQKLRVQYDAFYNMMGMPDNNYYPRMNSGEFIRTAEQVFDPVTFPWATVSLFGNTNSGSSVSPHEMIQYNRFRGLISQQRAQQQLDSLSSIDNDGQITDNFYRNQSLFNSTLSISGGGNVHTFYGSFSYTGNQSSVPGEKNNTYTMNMRNDFTVSSRIKFFIVTDLSRTDMSKSRLVSVDNRFVPYQLFKDPATGNPAEMSYLSFMVTDSVRRAFESQSRLDLSYRPLDEIDRGLTEFGSLQARITGGASLKLLRGLRFEGTYGYGYTSSSTSNFDAENSFPVRSTLVSFTQAPVAPSTVPTYYLPRNGGQYSTNEQLSRNWTVRNQLVLDTSFASRKHQLTVLFGQEAQERFGRGTYNTVLGYDPLLLTYQNVDLFTLDVTGLTNPVAARNTGNRSLYTQPVFTQNQNMTRISSYYSNAGYTFLRRYSLNASWRIDESNLFGVDKSAQRKPVWSIGAKWNLLEEKFLNQYTGISVLALRMTYGITGNAPSPGSATSKDVLTVRSSSFAPGPGLSVATYANKALTWERTENYNLGIDFGFLGRRITGTVDLYHRNTTDLIGQVPVNFLSGTSSIIGNFGDMNNRGVELSLNTLNIVNKDFSWNTVLNLSYNKNTITRLQQTSPITDLSRLVQQTKYYEGYPALSIFAYNWAGLDELGDPQILLNDGSKYKAASTNNIPLESARFMGTFQPPWNGGLLNFIRYRNFNISSSIIFNLGHYGRRDVNDKFSGRLTPNRVSFSHGGSPELQTGNFHSDLLKRWMKPGDELVTDIPSYLTTNTNRRNTAYYVFGSQNVYNASFIKLRDITISMGLPSGVSRKIGAEEVRFRVQLANIMIWKANDLGIDPEFQVTDINYTLGRVLPVGQGAITLGLNVRF
jgi:TonB-linked SusC/RagA family outer membrane protein